MTTGDLVLFVDEIKNRIIKKIDSMFASSNETNPFIIFSYVANRIIVHHREVSNVEVILALLAEFDKEDKALITMTAENKTNKKFLMDSWQIPVNKEENEFQAVINEITKSIILNFFEV